MVLSARKDHYSRSLVRTIAAAAGVATVVPEHDQNSIDMSFTAPDTATHPGAKLDAQLKCSQNVKGDGESLSYVLPIKNYNDLRWPLEQLQVPRILIVVPVPPDPDDWITIEPEAMRLGHPAYWVSLAGAAAVENRSSVTVTIPREQVLDAAALHRQLAGPSSPEV